MNLYFTSTLFSIVFRIHHLYIYIKRALKNKWRENIEMKEKHMEAFEIYVKKELFQL